MQVVRGGNGVHGVHLIGLYSPTIPHLVQVCHWSHLDLDQVKLVRIILNLERRATVALQISCLVSRN